VILAQMPELQRTSNAVVDAHKKAADEANVKNLLSSARRFRDKMNGVTEEQAWHMYSMLQKIAVEKSHEIGLDMSKPVRVAIDKHCISAL